MRQKLKSFLLGSLKTSSIFFDGCYLFFRLHIGLSIADGAGLAKMYHKINEKGGDSWNNLAFGPNDWFINQVKDLGFTFISPSFWAYIAVFGEFFGGLFIAFGIFTRLSSIQLAFQFFVVAFIWDKGQTPLLGMSYQQLIFWSYMITLAVGDGRFSLTNLFSKLKSMKNKSKISSLPLIFILVCSFINSYAQQTNQVRVSFEVKNPTLNGMEIEFRSFYDLQNHQLMGAYGFGMNPMSTHAVNMIAPVRIYKIVKGKKVLILVVNKQDEGKSFLLNKSYIVSDVDLKRVKEDEFNEKNDNLNKNIESKSIEDIALEKGIDLISFKLKPSKNTPKKIYLRYQLPWEKKPKGNVGISVSSTKPSMINLNLPIGTKVYSCSGPYWEESNQITEKLIIEVTSTSKNQVFNF